VKCVDQGFASQLCADRKTFAALAGASDRVPTDRPMDGVDASQFLLGKDEHTGRDALLFFGPDGSLMSVKWHNIKIWLR